LNLLGSDQFGLLLDQAPFRVLQCAFALAQCILNALAGRRVSDRANDEGLVTGRQRTQTDLGQKLGPIGPHRTELATSAHGSRAGVLHVFEAVTLVFRTQIRWHQNLDRLSDQSAVLAVEHPLQQAIDEMNRAVGPGDDHGIRRGLDETREQPGVSMRLRDVECNGVECVVERWSRRPGKPEVRTVAAPVTVLEIRNGLSGREHLPFTKSGLPVGRVDEFEKGGREQILHRVSQRAFPGPIQSPKTPIASDDAHQLLGRFEESLEFLVRICTVSIIVRGPDLVPTFMAGAWPVWSGDALDRFYRQWARAVSGIVFLLISGPGGDDCRREFFSMMGTLT
jgi:hypothetical protein